MKFSELDYDVQERLIAKERNTEPYSEWYEYTLEYWKEKLIQLGFYKPEIYFSGFCSQGDGAAFSFTWFDCKEFLKVNKLYKDWRRLYIAIMADEVEIYGNGSVSNFGYQTYSNLEYNVIELFTKNEYHRNKRENLLYEDWIKFEEYIKQWIRDIGSEIYIDLENEWDYLTGREAAIEYLSEQEYSEDGEII